MITRLGRFRLGLVSASGPGVLGNDGVDRLLQCTGLAGLRGAVFFSSIILAPMSCSCLQPRNSGYMTSVAI